VRTPGLGKDSKERVWGKKKTVIKDCRSP